VGEHDATKEQPNTTPPLPYRRTWGLVAYLKGLFGFSSPCISPEAQGVFLALARLTESEMRDTAFQVSTPEKQKGTHNCYVCGYWEIKNTGFR